MMAKSRLVVKLPLFFWLFVAHLNLYLVEAATAPQHGLAAAFSSSTLELDVGLHLSVSESNNTTFSFAIPASNNQSWWFLPILSSASFKSFNSSQSPGFSFGFLFNTLPNEDYTKGYLAVCGGISGNLTNLSSPSGGAHLFGTGSMFWQLDLPAVLDGFVMPLWGTINDNVPLISVNASLDVVEEPGPDNVTSTKQLQLRESDGTVVWSVSNVGLMEMQDSGILLIYDSSSKTNMVWQSPRDTLFVGQKLGVGEQMTSNDGSYLARMEKGGLVLSISTLEFMNERPAPFWAIPVLRHGIANVDQAQPFSKQVLLSSPCAPNDTAYTLVDNFSVISDEYATGFVLEAGSCINDMNLGIISGSAGVTSNQMGPLNYVRLGNDGWLHSYAVSQLARNSVPLPTWDTYVVHDGTDYDNPNYIGLVLQVLFWGTLCSVPNHCGPLGICTPFVPSTCTCSQPFLKAIDSNNANQGCARITPLPKCTKDEHVNTTEFFRLNNTSSIFLFSGWPFNFTSGKEDACMKSCSSNCSCNGFFYQVNTSSCFFITDEMSLLNVTNDNNVKETDWRNVYGTQASNYVTYLKKVKDSVPPPPVNNPPTSRPAKTAVIAISVVLSFTAISLGLGFAMFVLYRRANKRRIANEKAKQDAEEEQLRNLLPQLPTRFSYQDLYEATAGFSKLLGKGGCGSVYAGTFPDGKKVAVKTLQVSMKGQLKQFLAEVATIGRTNHQNIVCLVGFCWDVSNRLLVYEYMEKGSLDRWLFNAMHVTDVHDRAAASLLDWQTRYDIVLGIARGLSYLHEECTEPILHFDIKPQNILLDDGFGAKLADFGMSRFMPRDMSKVMTGVRGTPGYIAPEWLLHGAVSKKSDVYSMGMVMLEVLGGRKNVDLNLLNKTVAVSHDDGSNTRQVEEWHFPSWAACKCEQGFMMELVDKRLQGEVDKEQVERLVYTAFWCIQEDPVSRPYAPLVVQWLEGISAVKQPPFGRVVHSQVSKLNDQLRRSTVCTSDATALSAR